MAYQIITLSEPGQLLTFFVEFGGFLGGDYILPIYLQGTK